MKKPVLNEALSELTELDEYADEEGLTKPSSVAKQFAENLLTKLIQERPHSYSVSLWEDGDVVVYTTGEGWRISVYCRADGGASFYFNSPDERDQESHYQKAQDMPIPLITGTLKKMPFSTAHKQRACGHCVTGYC